MKERCLIVLIAGVLILGLYEYAHAQSANILAVESISNVCDNEILNDAAGDQLGPYNSNMLMAKVKIDSARLEKDQETVADDRSHVQSELIGLQGIGACQANLQVNQTNGT